MKKITRQEYDKLKSMLSAIDKGIRISSYDFLTLYNRVTGEKKALTVPPAIRGD